MCVAELWPSGVCVQKKIMDGLVENECGEAVFAHLKHLILSWMIRTAMIEAMFGNLLNVHIIESDAYGLIIL